VVWTLTLDPEEAFADPECVICRGLRTALVEREDFGSGTSSKSTKLVHGGVRYLEKAVFNLDYGQLKLVFEALHERKRMLENAPHLCTALPIMTVSDFGLAHSSTIAALWLHGPSTGVREGKYTLEADLKSPQQF